jgi:hypothetical protein
MTTFIISRKIGGSESPWRTPHFVIGLFILFLYPFQIYIGLNVFLQEMKSTSVSHGYLAEADIRMAER